MKEIRHLTLFLTLGILTACSESPKQEQVKTGLFTESSDNNSVASSGNFSDEPEGPQYQTPTMDVLRGKPQMFPAKYPLRRYPGSKVAMVDVRPNRRPGYKNMVMLNTADKIPNVSTFYERELLQENWKKTYEWGNEIYHSTRWEKGNIECEVRVSNDVVANSNKKNIQLLYGIKPRSYGASK
ncbi:MAG: hypothetical protein K2X27_08735 [Candidatus Obscuribacterales bacterium]|nr:hypothetical protein [Candidatus Obscuribacterales bacterium]